MLIIITTFKKAFSGLELYLCKYYTHISDGVLEAQKTRRQNSPQSQWLKEDESLFWFVSVCTVSKTASYHQKLS